MRAPFNIQVVNTIPRYAFPKPVQRINEIASVVRPAFANPVVIDLSLGDTFLIVATSNIAFQVSNPISDPGEGTYLDIIIANNSGGALGAVTFGANFHTAAGIAFPANGQAREYNFIKINGLAGAGNTWMQITPSADTPNPN